MTNPEIDIDLTRSIEVAVGNKTIAMTIGKTIEMNLVSVTNITANYVAQNIPFYFNGDGGDTYLKYNSTTEKLELWVKGIKQKEWGVVSADPFA